MPVRMLSFCDLPHDTRARLRAAIEAAGGSVAAYCGPYVQVAIPCPSVPFFAVMEAAGLELDEHSLHFFPLGSDKPPERLRHYGHWLYGNFSPAP